MMGPNLQEECQYHSQQKSVGICFNQDCYRRGTICQECQHNYHSEHKDYIQLFDLLERRDILHLRQLVGNKQIERVSKLGSLFSYYQMNQHQICFRFKQIKEQYVQQFRKQLEKMNVQILEQLEKRLDCLASQFSRHVKESDNVQKMIDQFDRLFGINEMVERQKQIVNSYNQELIFQQINSLQKLKEEVDKDGITINMNLKAEKELKNYQKAYEIVGQKMEGLQGYFQEQVNGFRDQTVEEIEKVVRDIGREIIGVADHEAPKEWKQWQAEGLVPVLKIVGLMDCEFMKKAKDQQQVYDVEQFLQNKFYESAVFDSYYLQGSEYIVIEAEFENRILYTKLQKEDDRCLGDIMRDGECEQYELTYVEGEKCPLRLFGGEIVEYSEKHYGYMVQWWIKKGYLLGGGIYYYNQEGDWEDCEIGGIGIDGIGVVNGIRLKEGVYPHLQNNIDFKVNVYLI